MPIAATSTSGRSAQSSSNNNIAKPWGLQLSQVVRQTGARSVPSSTDEHTSCTHPPHQTYMPRAELLKRTFGVDALRCPGCDGRFTVRSVFRRAWVAGNLLGVLGGSAEQQALAFARGPPSEERWF
ncbi:MAG: hypothetical protein ACJAZO_004086 [Myxococcota bacterium]|jgi:hypothetical protein